MTTSTPLAPNHHAHHPGFSGVRGHLYAVLFAVGRGRDANLAGELTGVGPGDHVVDIGCGPGNALRAASRRGATGIGVDPAMAMLRVGRLITRRSSGLRYQLGAAESLPVDDGSSTVVWSLAAVHHWKDVAAGVAEARRVLQPGGRFLAVERRTTAGATGVASHGWTDEQAQAFADICTEAGFTDVRIGEHSAVISVLATRP